MRKSIVVFLAISLFMAVPSISFAQESGEEESPMMGKKKMMGMCRMHGMMKKMIGKSIVATEDGGVIVMVGNKLYKYDKDLELKKEAEIKMDTEGIKGMMQEGGMMKKCPMGEVEESSGTEKMAGHESHH